MACPNINCVGQGGREGGREGKWNERRKREMHILMYFCVRSMHNTYHIPISIISLIESGVVHHIINISECKTIVYRSADMETYNNSYNIHIMYV